MTIISAPTTPGNAPVDVTRLATPTVTLRGWHRSQWLRPIPDGLVHVFLHQEPTKPDYADRLEATPTGAWGHLSKEQQYPERGYVWPSAEDDEDSGEFVFTYVGIYRIDREVFDSSTGIPTTTFQAVR
jgi:hypothetical protein